MQPAECLRGLIRPALAGLPDRFRGENAERMILAIMVQESGLKHRVQRGQDGQPLPHLARGLAQFELTGVRLTLQHPTTAWLRYRLYTAGLPLRPEFLHWLIGDESDMRADVVAVWFARALLWTHPAPLPTGAAGQANISFAYYCETWRPGKPHLGRWLHNWSRVCTACDECRVTPAKETTA